MMMKKRIWLPVIIFGAVAVTAIFVDMRATGLGVLNSAIKLVRFTGSESHQVERNIIYGQQSWQALDVYRQPNQQALAPVLLFIHGGSWSWGNKELYYFTADAFVRLGYTVVLPDYTKYPQARFPSFVEDGAQALAWVKANIAQYNGDPDNIFVSGHSAGAHTGALLMTDKNYLREVGLQISDIRGFAGIAGPYNFTPKWPQYVEMFGKQNFHRMKASSHVDGTEPPILVLHGQGDNAVGLFNQQTLVADLEKSGSKVNSILYAEDIGHNRILLNLHPWFANKVNVAKDIDAFFRSHML